MKRIIGIAVMVAAALALAPGAVSASSARVPVVYGLPDGHLGGSNFAHGKIRPRGELMWTGDGSGWFIIHSWSTWTRTGAKGSATAHVRICWGGCDKHGTEHTTLRLYRVRAHRGQPYFTRLHFYLRHKIGGLGSSTLVFCKRGSPAWYYSC